MSIKESNLNEKNWSKFSHLLPIRAEVADPPPPPYGQPDRKISVFLGLPVLVKQIKLDHLSYFMDNENESVWIET